MKLFPRMLAGFSIALLASACGTAATPPPTAAIAVAPPTAAAAPTVAATALPTADVPAAAATALALPTAVPMADAPLPAPIYVVLGGQIVRIERDGTTRMPITNEPSHGDALTVVELAVSPVDNALAYVTQTVPGTALIGADAHGGQRTVLFQRPNANVSMPRWSPDGKTLAVALNEFTADGTTTGGGVYLLSAGGGEPKLLQANGTAPTTPTDTLDPQAVGYNPLAFSPDGSKLLVARYSLQVEQCELAIIPVAGGAITTFQPPDQALRPACGPATWNADSSAVYTAFTPKDQVYAANAGLWQVDAISGVATPVVAPLIDKQAVIVGNPTYLRAGEISAFIAQTAKVPSMGDETELPYQMARIAVGSGTWVVLRTETYPNGDSGVWAADGSGALLLNYNNKGIGTLTWLPADGSPARIIDEKLDVTSFAWGH